MADQCPLVNPESKEPLRRGAVVSDVDGHEWKHGTTRWTCQVPVGTRYFSKIKKRMLIVESVGRLPWYALERSYGPLVYVDLKGQGGHACPSCDVATTREA